MSFPDTRWSVLLTLQDLDETASREVLGELCAAYWYPVYAFVRRSDRSSHEAEDLTQGFFAHLLERRAMEGASPEKGRFRSFLLGALKNFLSTEARRDAAWKRGGRVLHVPLDVDEGEARFEKELADHLSPDRLYDRAWADALLRRAMAALAGDYHRANRSAQFAALQECLSGKIESASYERIGQALGMSVSAVTNAVYRLRLRYRDLVRQEIARTVSSDAEVDEELRAVFAALSR